jgi:hypothetical protein
MTEPLQWIMDELEFARYSPRVSKEIQNYCAMLQEGLKHNIAKTEVLN